MRAVRSLATLLALLAWPGAPASAQDAGAWPAPSTPSVLPRPDFRFPGNVGRTILDSDPPQFPQPVQAPEGRAERRADPARRRRLRPVRDLRRRHPSPTMDALAAEGLRFNRFHTTALCSPTRAALITGRNHHSAASGGITEAATGYDGYTCSCRGAAAPSARCCGRTAT